MWVAEVDAPNGPPASYEPVALYSTTNGFWIDETGAHTVTIRYRPQRWFFQGAASTGGALLASVSTLLYGWRRRHRDAWTERVERAAARLGRWQRDATRGLSWW